MQIAKGADCMMKGWTPLEAEKDPTPVMRPCCRL